MQARVYLTGIVVSTTMADGRVKPSAKIYYLVKSPERDLHCIANIWLKGSYRELKKVLQPRKYVSITGTLISLSYKGRNNNSRAAIQLISAEDLGKKATIEEFKKIRKNLRKMKRIYYEFFELKNQQGMRYYANRAEIVLPEYLFENRKTLSKEENNVEDKRNSD